MSEFRMPKTKGQDFKRDKSKRNDKENIKRRKFFTYSPSKIKNALKDIKNGMPVLKASQLHQVPRSTLRYKLQGDSPVDCCRVGPELSLGSQNEQILVNWVLELSRMGFPISRDVLNHSVKKLVEIKEIKTPFTNNIPGRKWFYGFLKRHPALSV